MIHIHYIYNRSKKTVSRCAADLNFASMERDIRRLFPLGDRPLFFFYYDELHCRILILDDDDMLDVTRMAGEQLAPFRIHLNTKERLIREHSDLEFLQRMFVRECLRHQTRRQFAKKRLIAELTSIREVLMRAGVKPHIVKRLIRNVSQEVQMHFVDATFDGLPSSELDTEATHSRGESGEVAPSFSSIVDRTTASFMSKGDFSLFSEPIFAASGSDQVDFCLNAALTVDEGEAVVVCSKCRLNVASEMRFTCERCPKLLLCEQCCQTARHKHELRPLFFLNECRKKIDALSKIFRRLKFNRRELFFKTLKEHFYRPHR